MTVYGYTRVSSETQVRDGQGLSIQSKKIKQYCLLKDLSLEQIFTDPAESGATPLDDRPAGRTMLSVLQKGDHVVVPSLDRAWRSVIDACATVERWEKQGVTVHLLDLGIDLSAPHGKLLFTVVAAVAEFERKIIGERIRAGVRAKIARDKGVWGSVLRYGYCRDDSGKIVEEPDEQVMLRLILGFRETGMSYLKIARKLNRGGYSLPRGGQPWTGHGVDKVCRKAKLPPPGAD